MSAGVGGDRFKSVDVSDETFWTISFFEERRSQPSSSGSFVGAEDLILGLGRVGAVEGPGAFLP